MTELNKTQILLVVLIMIVVGYVVFPKAPVIRIDTLQELVDSMNNRDEKRKKEINILRNKYTQDSFSISIIKKRLDSINIKKEVIKKEYDKKRNHIDTASFDEQSVIFSKWTEEELSKENK